MRRALTVALMSLALFANAIPSASADPGQPEDCDNITTVKDLLNCVV